MNSENWSYERHSVSQTRNCANARMITRDVDCFVDTCLSTVRNFSNSLLVIFRGILSRNRHLIRYEYKRGSIIMSVPACINIFQTFDIHHRPIDSSESFFLKRNQLRRNSLRDDEKKMRTRSFANSRGILSEVSFTGRRA